MLTKSRRKRRTGHVASMGEMINIYKSLIGKPEGKIPRRRFMRRWEDNIKIDLEDLGCEGVGGFKHAEYWVQ
jgi:hypothetical protein